MLFYSDIFDAPARAPTFEAALQPTVSDLPGHAFLFFHDFGGLSAGTCGNASSRLSVWSGTATCGRLLLFPLASFPQVRNPTEILLCQKTDPFLLYGKIKTGNIQNSAGFGLWLWSRACCGFAGE
tara:strand:+ start:183868 stop:184242 length:375 start_codon:yes stop_codon:yes gene_type:complete